MSLNLGRKPKNYPTVGVAVVAWNNAQILPECLNSIQRQTYLNIQTIVLDNNSDDNTIEIIESDFSWVNLIKSQTNTGFAKGNNLIIQEFIKNPTVQYIALLNSDATLDTKWVENIVNDLEGKPKVAFAQGLTLDYYNHDVVDSTHIFINRKGQSIQAGYRSARTDAYKESRRVFGVNAAACIVTRDFLNSQPFDYLFDEDFFMYLEDVDVAARSLTLGWNNYYVPKAVAYHMGSASSGKNPGFSVYMVNRNILPMLVKNIPSALILKILPRMFIADMREIYRIAKGRNYKIISKYITGRLAGCLLIPKYFGKARLIRGERKLSNGEIWRLMKTGSN